MRTILLGLLICAGLSSTTWAEAVSVSTEPRRYAELDESFYNSSFMSWAGDNLSDRLNLADAKASDARAARLSAVGVTGVLYNGRHFRLSYPEEYDLIEKYGRTVADACHRHGIKVVEHHEFTVFSYASYPRMLRHLDWLQTDIRTGEPWRWACIHNPGFLDAYGDYLASLAKRAGADGYMLDEVGFAGSSTCGCVHCRASYTAALGKPFPAWAEGEGSFGDSEYRNVVRWRSKLTPRAQQVVMDRIRQVNPRAMNMKYCSDYADPGTAARAWDLTAHAALYSPFVGWELMVAEALNGWRPILRGLKLRLSYGNYYGIPVWSLNREMTSREAVYLGWALCQAGKHSIWYGARALETEEDLDYFARYNAWPHVMPHRHARCLTDTGVLISHQTRFTDPGHRLFWNEFRGWTDMLIMGNRQFDALLDGDLEVAGRLGKYSVLLLVSQASLTDKQITHLTEWVRRGGAAIVTGVTASRDGFGNLRKQNGLAEAMGIAPVAAECRGGTVRVKGDLDGLAINFKAGHGHFPANVTAPGRVRVLATMTGANGGESPAIAETRLGEGRFIYVGVDLGSQNYEEKARNRWPLRGTWDAAQRALIWKLCDTAHARPVPAKIEAPEGVVGVVYQEHGGKQDGRIHLHLLNTTGMTVKPGYRFQYGRHEDITWPAIKGAITLHLTTELLGPAVARTPERDETAALEAKRDGQDTVITIPGSLLGGYLHVSAPARALAGQGPQPVPIEITPSATRQAKGSRLTGSNRECPWPTASDSKVTPKGTAAFEIAPGNALRVSVGGRVLIAGDGLDLAGHEYTTPPTETCIDTVGTCTTCVAKSADGWTGTIAGGASGDGIVWARETATHDDRLEVTLAAMISPGDRGADAYTARYMLRIPCELLKGARYTARVGRHQTVGPLKKGVFTGEEPEEAKVPLLGHVRTMQVEGGKLDFLLDLNACGPWGLYLEDYSTAFKGHFFRRGEHYTLVICTLDARWGAKLNNKIIFRLGRCDLSAIHPIGMTHYTYPLPVLRRIQFTPEAACAGMAFVKDRVGYDKEFEAWGGQPYDEGAGVGWVGKVQGAAISPKRHPGLGPLFGGGWRGRGPARYRMNHINGRVLCNVLLTGAGGPTECNVRVNEGRAANVRVKEGERFTLTVPAAIREGRLDVVLDGEGWTLSGIVPQLLMGQEEDYLFDRTWWAFGKAPWAWGEFRGAPAWREYSAKYAGGAAGGN
ncbi:MAG: beta-galactosidase trimerization domain-containing protein [Phycisphaerae bacterium]|nr:beta-galactosidase trimerization domain-containing protein [Phycisphaerae bacterium]